MKALVFKGKDGLVVEEVPTPTPGDNQVMIRIANCGICGTDLFFYRAGVLPNGAIMGHELSGVVESVGNGISGIKPGDRVIGRPTGCGECKWCKVGMENLCPDRRSIGLGKTPGGFAEFLVVDEDMVIPVPDNLPLDQASMADQLGSAIHGMKTIGFKKGETVLVTGAGPIGLCAIMLLKHAGAEKIVVSEMLENRAAMARKFGADVIIDPGKQSLPTELGKLFGRQGVDCVIECSGNQAAVKQVIQSAPTGCRISLVGMCTKPIDIIPFVIWQKHLTISGSFANTQAECIECMDIMASGEVPSAELITKKITIDQLPREFDNLLVSKDQIKVMMEC